MSKDSAGLAKSLAKDKKFRKELRKAISHGTIAQRRAKRKVGYLAIARRINNDPKIRRELKRMMQSLDKAWTRVEKKRSHKLRNLLLLVGIGGAAAAAAKKPEVRNKVTGTVSNKVPGVGGPSPRTIDTSIEVNVPVSTAYNQWTQFEDFPLFMEGVDHVQQLDDTRLHWAATVAGKKAEWDAKILEQHPDKQISWISEDGKKTRGTVSFEPRGDSKTLIRLSMSYQAEGPAETLGSAAGLDSRRVQGDLGRFKELIESRGTESGAWRGKVEAGQKK
ncbi:MAG: SRPBCC family protein [Gaiellaceae bacterium]